MQPLSNAAMRDIETVVHPYTNLATHRDAGPHVLERGKGIYVWDSAGNKLIEGMAGLWCTALGYGNEELIETATEQMRQLPYTHIFGGKSHDPAIALAEKLKDIAPCETSKVLFSTSGSEANDTQVKLIWYYNNAIGRPEKKKLISRIKGYHGVTVASASLTGLPANHTDFDLPIPNVLHTACPHHYRFGHEGETEDEFCDRIANEFEEMILREGPETVAAFFAEPVGGAGGVVVPPRGYYPKFRAICDKYDILMVADEVICGFGRLGEMWGSQAMEFEPDTVSCAKALTSAYMPLSAVLLPDRMYEAMVDESKKIGTFGHGYTYAGHPVASAVGLKTIEIYERDGIPQRAKAMAPVFQERLNRLADHPLVGETRGVGMIGAAELVADKATKRPFDPKQLVGAACSRHILNEGVILRNLGDTVAVCPPLIIEEDEVHILFDAFESALDATEAWVQKEGLRG
ncbi:MAG: aminotransferase [Pseudomonadota bacterium]